MNDCSVLLSVFGNKSIKCKCKKKKKTSQNSLTLIIPINKQLQTHARMFIQDMHLGWN